MIVHCIYTDWSQVIIPFSEDCFVLANSVDPDEMPHNAAFHMALHYLPKYTSLGNYSPKA